jgi:hypothetical protein
MYLRGLVAASCCWLLLLALALAAGCLGHSLHLHNDEVVGG